MKSLFFEEMKKLLIKRKILLVILLLLIAKMGFYVLFANQHILFSDKGLNEEYQTYMTFLNGRLTPEKERFILNEKNKYDESDVRLDVATNQITSGEISSEQFNKIVADESEYQNTKPVIEHIYKQYKYVHEEPDTRYFVDPSSWDGLLAGEQPDYLLILSVIIMCAIVFNYETESGMSVLNLTAVNGRLKLCVIKMSVAGLVCLLLTFCFFVIEVGIVYFQNGLSGFEFPMQSIPFFGAGTKQLSLISLLIWIISLRLLGILYLSSFVFLVSVFSNSTIITLLSNLALVLIPTFICGTAGTLYRLPFPTGFITGSGFFRGTEATPMDDGSISYIFREVPDRYFIVLVFSVILIICVLLIISAQRYAPVRVRSRYSNAN